MVKRWRRRRRYDFIEIVCENLLMNFVFLGWNGGGQTVKVIKVIVPSSGSSGWSSGGGGGGGMCSFI